MARADLRGAPRLWAVVGVEAGFGIRDLVQSVYNFLNEDSPEWEFCINRTIKKEDHVVKISIFGEITIQQSGEALGRKLVDGVRTNQFANFFILIIKTVFDLRPHLLGVRIDYRKQGEP